MSLLVAIATKQSGRQCLRVLTAYDGEPCKTLVPRACVHAVGGGNVNATLTQKRRDSIRKLHNAKAADGQRCPLHLTGWKKQLQKQHPRRFRNLGVAAAVRPQAPVLAPVAPVAQAAPVPAAPAAPLDDNDGDKHLCVSPVSKPTPTL